MNNLSEKISKDSPLSQLVKNLEYEFTHRCDGVPRAHLYLKNDTYAVETSYGRGVDFFDSNGDPLKMLNNGEVKNFSVSSGANFPSTRLRGSVDRDIGIQKDKGLIWLKAVVNSPYRGMAVERLELQFYVLDEEKGYYKKICSQESSSFCGTTNFFIKGECPEGYRYLLE